MTVTVGLDEVGRGCWAGPLVACALVIQKPIHNLNDSKLLSKVQREKLSPLIKQNANYGIGWVSPAEVDNMGLTRAVSIAMERALEGVSVEYDEIIIDGNYNFLATYMSARTLIKADALIPAVSAASILAKVTRDDYMIEQSVLFPGYGFEKHVGYGTKAHIDALKQLGTCELHRMSYKPIKALL